MNFQSCLAMQDGMVLTGYGKQSTPIIVSPLGGVMSALARRGAMELELACLKLRVVR